MFEAAHPCGLKLGAAVALFAGFTVFQLHFLTAFLARFFYGFVRFA
jgi:hypothetical protein